MIDRLTAVVESGILTATRGLQTPELEARFADLCGVGHAIATSSGSAAVHTAIAAIDPDPGDEIVTTSITDMGALTPILYQGAIPVFADVDAATGMVTARTVEAALSDRTRAVVVTHLFGAPAAVDEIRTVADAAGVAVIEDCAQAYLTRRRGRLVGSFGALGCFSTQQGKHLTTGEGGVVVTDDTALARRARVFVNKAWPYGEASPDHEFLALNYRITELQAAVANAQLEHLDAMVATRRRTVAVFIDAISGCGAVTPFAVHPDDTATWWKVPLLVDPALPGGPTALADRLGALGVTSAPRYIQKPAFECRVFRDQVTFGRSHWPFDLARPDAVDYDPERFPATYDYLARVLVLPWNERYTEEHARIVADAVLAAVAEVEAAA